MEEGNGRLTDSRASALRLTRVTRRFPLYFGLRSRTALADVDLELAEGIALGLIGPNGSGKSTLLRIAAGVDRPSAGQAAVFGADLEGRGGHHVRRRVAFLPDDSPFPGELSARAALDLCGALVGMPRADRKVRVPAMLERVGLGPAAGRALRAYSRGMLRRFGLAQAFLHDPDLVLLDEPTAGLDAPGYGVLEELTSEARARGATLVVASHVLSDLHATCDELAVLIGGRCVARGATADVLAVEERDATIAVEGLGPAARDELAAWVAAHGGTLAPASDGRVVLGRLFQRLARTDAPPQGAGRPGSHP